MNSIVAIPDGSDFPLENIPFGVMSPSAGAAARPATRLGDHVVDLRVLADGGALGGEHLGAGECFSAAELNAFMALGRPAWREARARLQGLLCGADQLSDSLRSAAILPLDSVSMQLPATIGDYTDFYASREHATNVGTMFRGPDNALMPNWLHLPVGYHGRASSIIASGTPVKRPSGQQIPKDATDPVFGPSRLMDFELEMGCFVGRGNDLGSPIAIDAAAEHLFGLVLVNDWSARDIQKWEYVPLGPFLGKSFATTISPWIVTLDALEPFRCDGPDQSEPQPLPYLRGSQGFAYDVELEVWLENAALDAPFRLTRTNFKAMYWSMAQQMAHHTVNGCNMRSGDMFASGTISGPDKGSRGSMLEIAWRGTDPVALPDGSTRSFIADGDSVVMKGWAEKDGLRIGFGECRGELLPAD